MGGLQSFGPVRPERDEPLFHAPWEKRALGLTIAMGATRQWTIDQSRSARESLPPATYLSSSYYKIWVTALENLMVERKLISRDELDDGRSRMSPVKLARTLQPEAVPATLAAASPTTREAPAPARFSQGQRVRAKDWNPFTHTRLPRYCRGKIGTVVNVHGFHVFADASAQGRDEAQWLYNVRFEGEELWGAFTTASAVYVDCWEPYLEPA